MSDENDKKEPTEGTQDPGYVTMDQLQTFLKSQLGPVQKALEALSAPKPETKKEDLSEEKVTMAKLQKQIQALQEEKQAETKAKQDMQLRSAVKDTLVKNGVPSHMVKAAMAVLVDADKKVGFGEAGDIVFRGQYGEQDLETGLKDYFKSEEGKTFLPPKGAQGSSDKRYSGTTQAGGKQQVSDEDIFNKIFNQ